VKRFIAGFTLCSTELHIISCNTFSFIIGVRVIIDRKAQLTLLGTEMDYVETKLSSEFVFNNPNIKGTCGCGESFSV
jgi:iron-sulfur cluster assembly accessory protein